MELLATTACRVNTKGDRSVNGEHDLGGMQSFGAVPRPQNEPVFHAPWEGRVEAMTMVLLMGGHLAGGGVLRYAIESLPPLRYLSFDSHVLWGDTAEPNLKVHVGLWERYLEAA
jgi:hypothetical protein